MSNQRNQLEQLSTFINEQVNKIQETTSSSEMNESDIPSEVLNVINNKVNQIRMKDTSQVAQDIITQTIYDMEHDRNEEERKEIIKMIHIRNISKMDNKINSQFLSDEYESDNNYYNLDYLIQNIYKLPKLITQAPQDREEEIDIDIDNQLKEYKVLREELINHCRAIQIGEDELSKLKLQCDKLEALKFAIRENSGSDDINEYMKLYNKKIISELEELTYNLEERLKSLDPKDKKEIHKLKGILDSFI